MSNPLNLLTGPARSGKTERLLTRYRLALARQAPGATLWLAPTQRSAADIRGRLLADGLTACLTPGVMTFAQFAEGVLAASPQVVRPLGDMLKRQLLRRLIDAENAAGRLRHFRAIADTPGLVDLFVQFISELKRQEIWPDDFRRACQRRGLADKDRELLAVYQAYQDCLLKYQLYDAEGRFWSARELLKKGQREPFDRLELVVADGFTDFTRPQHEILEVLAERASETWITLPLDPDTDRPELFGKSRATRDQLQRRHAGLTGQGLKEERATRPTVSAWPALDHIERHVFANPRLKADAPSVEGIEILAASRQVGEVELLARRIKLLLVGAAAEATAGPVAPGARVLPGEIAVVFRNLPEYAPLVREVFARFGIPTAIEAGRKLGESRALAALVMILELAVNDWPFERLLALLNSNYFQPAWPEWNASTARSAERVVRELQVPEGRARLFDRIRRWARLDQRAKGEPPQGDDPRWPEVLKSRQSRADRALPIFDRLAAMLDVLPAKATPGQWSAALERLASEVGLTAAMETADVPTAMVAHDKAASARLREALVGMDTLCARLGEDPPLLERHELVSLLRDVLAHEQLPAGHDETGRVRVLTAASARALSVPYLFVAGLSERSFPPPASDNRLYSEVEARQLHEAGLPLVLRGERNQEEMLLFYEVFTRATRRLYLSYPALDEKAQALLPSPYLVEVERACGATAVARTTDPDLSPLPRTKEPLCEVDFRLLAVDRALAGNDALLHGFVRHAPPALAHSVLAGLEITASRANHGDFGPFEGLLEGEASRARLVQAFGAERLWSASNLETYATCPYRFFAERVLRLEPLAELQLATDYGQRGGRLHETLSWLHRKLTMTGELPSELHDEAFHALREEALASLQAFVDDDDKLASALLEIDRQIISLWTQAYRTQHGEFDQLWNESCEQAPRPAHFEASFGQSPPAPDPISRLEPLELKVGGETIKLAGRIDRIDIGKSGGQAAFVVIDYKSSAKRPSRSKNPTLDGRALQLELYSIATQEVLLAHVGAAPLQAGYWMLRDKGFKAWMECYRNEAGRLVATEEWTAIRQQVEQKVWSLVQGIRQGHFPVHSLDDHCTGTCPFSTVCRINQVRSLGKEWPTTPTNQS
jgi:ATP-dependent helicase/nuclease subunit B